MEYFRLGICNCGCGRRIDQLRAVKGYLIRYLNGHSAPKVKYSCGKCRDQSWIIECKCGCGETLAKRNRFYELREFSFGHAIRIRDQTGEKNSMWKGGKRVTQEGYHFTRIVGHPNNRNGYVPNHRLVMEQYLKILFDEDVYIPSRYDVHHIDLNPENNSLMNLEILTRREHTTTHNIVDRTGWFCSNCGSTETWVRKDGRPEWRKDGKGGHLCNKCNSNIKWHKVYKNKK